MISAAKFLSAKKKKYIKDLAFFINVTKEYGVIYVVSGWVILVA